MIVTRQLVLCWLLGALWIGCGLVIFCMPRFVPNYYRTKGPSLSWRLTMKGEHFALLQINRGCFMEYGDWKAFHLDKEIKEVFRNHENGAARNISAVSIAGNVFVLPVSFDCLCFLIGLALFVFPTYTIYRKQRKIAHSLPHKQENP